MNNIHKTRRKIERQVHAYRRSAGIFWCIGTGLNYPGKYVRGFRVVTS